MRPAFIDGTVQHLAVLPTDYLCLYFGETKIHLRAGLNEILAWPDRSSVVVYPCVFWQSRYRDLLSSLPGERLILSFGHRELTISKDAAEADRLEKYFGMNRNTIDLRKPIYFNGGLHTGSQFNGKPHGTGTVDLGDRTFEGSFDKGDLTSGKLTYADGRIFSWGAGVAPNKSLIPDPHGMMSWPDGHIFVGSFNGGGLPDGKGFMAHPNGDWFVGQFSDGLRNGSGGLCRVGGETGECIAESGQPALRDFVLEAERAITQAQQREIDDLKLDLEREKVEEKARLDALKAELRRVKDLEAEAVKNISAQESKASTTDDGSGPATDSTTDKWKLYCGCIIASPDSELCNHPVRPFPIYKWYSVSVVPCRHERHEEQAACEESLKLSLAKTEKRQAKEYEKHILVKNEEMGLRLTEVPICSEWKKTGQNSGFDIAGRMAKIRANQYRARIEELDRQIRESERAGAAKSGEIMLAGTALADAADQKLREAEARHERERKEMIKKASDELRNAAMQRHEQRRRTCEHLVNVCECAEFAADASRWRTCSF